MSNGGLYFGERSTCEYGFPADLWERAQRELAPAEAVLREMGRKHGLEFLSNLAGLVAWPARRLRAKQLMREIQIRLLFNPNYLKDGELLYTLDVTVTAGVGWFRKSHSYFVAASYSADELAHPARLTGDLDALMKRLGLSHTKS